MAAAISARLSAQALDQFRRQADTLADNTIDAIFRQGSIDTVNQFLGTLVDNDDILFAKVRLY